LTTRHLFSGHDARINQTIAAPLGEARLLNAAHRFQQATDWHTRTPEGF